MGSNLLNLPTYVQKHFVKARDQVYCIYKFLAVSMLVDPDPDPHSHYRIDLDPEEPNQCGSGFETLAAGSPDVAGAIAGTVPCIPAVIVTVSDVLSVAGIPLLQASLLLFMSMMFPLSLLSLLLLNPLNF